ncbi:helix-turn-helix domain-containing protein [Actinomadura sp. SCN-SB]|uniref:helix-turn-helix domain-containing protein n=1 Tax=Actinomadura sp. SCN-SB TaxID=3373092 RepID=UPI00375394BA
MTQHTHHPATATDVPPAMRLYNVTDVMTMLRLSRSTVFELIRTGRLRSVKQGRSRRVPGTAVADYIAQLENEAETTDA